MPLCGGREDEAFPLIEATIDSATAEGQGTAVQYAQWARSAVLNALGRYEEALIAAEYDGVRRACEARAAFDGRDRPQTQRRNAR